MKLPLTVAIELFSHPDAIYGASMKKLFQGAVEGYLDSGLSCSYVDPTTGARCVNKKDGHTKGHQDELGLLLEAGDYQGGAFDSTDFQAKMMKHIGGLLQTLDKFEDDNKLTGARSLHRKTLQQSNSWAISEAFRTGSSRTCFGCLFEAPEYQLPCGHYLCGSCIKNFDQTPDEHLHPARVTHKECFLCADKNPSHWPFELGVRPPLSGIRILSLDGGVRGIVELVILKRLQSTIGLTLDPCAFFDLIVGTSAGKSTRTQNDQHRKRASNWQLGGMIALGIGEHMWPLSRCIEKYEALAKTSFDSKFLSRVCGISWLARLFSYSIYTSTGIEGALKAAYGQDRELFSMKVVGTPSSVKHLPRVAVTTTVDQDLKIFANYNRGGAKIYLDSTCLTWEA
jgi:hypothetical protein